MIPQQVAVIDTEPTGIDLKTRKIVEVAFVANGYSWEQYVNPGEPIPPEVSAVHHITDFDVSSADSWDVVKAELSGTLNKLGITILVAHNAEFDANFLGLGPDQPWICTYKCALRQWPDAPSHKNEVLCYYLGVGARGRAGRTGNAHSALFDANQTAALLIELLKHQDLTTLVQWSKEPKQFSKIMFGKHIGKKWAEIDSGYLQWMCKQPDMDKDIVGCAAKELQRRR